MLTLSMFVFGVLIAVLGMTGLLAPQFLLTFLGFSSSASTKIFVMASSQASLAMGLFYILAAVHELRFFFRWSIPIRIMNFVVFASMVGFGIAPSRWLLVAGLELVGALVTGLAWVNREENEYELDPFKALQIASLILASLAAILIFDHFGIFGSASAFLVISSAGFIYAYQKFAPAHEE